MPTWRVSVGGVSRIIDIIKSVHIVLFYSDRLPPSEKSTLKTLILNDLV